jgi:tRNA-2-methylthio-N6-dimethylallyladenosine synthase
MSAFLTVQEGCDKFCTYCVVPYTRGAEVSRSMADLIEEAAQLVEGGTRELTLLGQNVNAWADGEADLAALIRRLATLPGLERIRYTTSHPINMSESLVRAHAEVEQLMPYLHLPVQAGSDRILKAMNRHHTAADYLAAIGRVRSARPDIAISGDFIVGFPGETEEDFAATLRIVEEVGYASAFTFKFSARPGTPAATMDGQVPEPVKDERLQRLQALVMEQSRAFNASKVGTATRILIDRIGRKPGQMIGKSPWLQSVFVETDAGIGDMVDVRLTAALPNSLAGVLCSSDGPSALVA